NQCGREQPARDRRLPPIRRRHRDADLRCTMEHHSPNV
ncbi:hypothetical protein EVAR_91968_1, partial [Eumeta japonica]